MMINSRHRATKGRYAQVFLLVIEDHLQLEDPCLIYMMEGLMPPISQPRGHSKNKLQVRVRRFSSS